MKNLSCLVPLWNPDEKTQAEERNPHSSFFILHSISIPHSRRGSS